MKKQAFLALSLVAGLAAAAPARAQTYGSYPTSMTGQYVQPQTGLGSWNGAQIGSNYGTTGYGSTGYGGTGYGGTGYAGTGYGSTYANQAGTGYGSTYANQAGSVNGFNPNNVTTNQYGVNTGYSSNGQNGNNQNRAGQVDDLMSLGRTGSLPSGTAQATIGAKAPEKVDVRGSRMEGSAKVVDGKTLVIGPYLIVLNGADAPSAGQTCSDARGMSWECGRRAMDRLNQLVAGQHVVCVGVDQAKVGVAATCKVGTIDLGRTMVQEGFAMSPKAVAPVYASDQVDAQSGKRGMWLGTFKNPWEVRASQ